MRAAVARGFGNTRRILSGDEVVLRHYIMMREADRLGVVLSDEELAENIREVAKDLICGLETIKKLQTMSVYLTVTDWNYYVARSVFIIKNVRIENSADISYKDIKVKVYQYTTSGPSPGQVVSSTTGVLPITVPAHSNKTYLKDGFPLGGGTFRYQAKNLQVLGATPVIE